MKKYNIAGIKLGFDFQYSEYFENNIEQYQIDYDEPVDYKISVKTYKHLDKPTDTPVLTYKNRFIYDFGDSEALVVLDDKGLVKQYIEYTKDHKRIDIFMTKHQKHTLAEMEYVLSGLLFLEIALKEYKLPFHASAIKHKNQAVLFSAPSGGGKSTHAHYWQMMLDDVTYINDDKPLIHKVDNQFVVSGTPWSGKDTINTNDSVPLKAIVFIEKSDTNTIEKLSTKDALHYIMRNSLRPRQKALVHNAMDLLNDIVKDIPLYLLQAKNDASSVTCVYKKLFQEGANHEN
ncbi:MAG: hypothetical protein ACOCU1_02965 [Bacillota bacterium]